jgi:outer membrane lipoprotein carrier protein
MRFLSRLVLFVALSATGFAASEDIHSTAKAVDDHYNHLRSLQAEFTQIYRGNESERTESGTLWLKKPGKMRWEYRSPKEKLFLSDGKNAWFYVPGDKQVRKTSVAKLEDLRSPLAFLLGKTKLEKELDGLSQAPDVLPLQPGNTVLRGVPKALAGRVGQVILEISPERHITRIIIEEIDGTATEYRITNQREDSELSEERFRFVPPPGIEVIEGQFGQ